MYSQSGLRTALFVLFCTTVLLGCSRTPPPEAAATKTPRPPAIKERFDVDNVEAAFPVGFSQDTAGGQHYIAYYDADKNFSIGYRKLGDTTFKKTVLDSKIGWDSHNYTALVVDDAGYIHVSGNMHIDSLFYWRSVRPYDASEFAQLHYMVGREEVSTTYPEFLETADGDLLFHYRYGGSGNGYEVYNKWDPATQTWSRFLDKPLIDGEGERNAYMQGPFYGSDGNYHLYWVWRETPDCATNHDFSYARSPDLKHWESGTGVPAEFPLTFGQEQLRVDPSDTLYGTGILNGVQAHAFDSDDRIVLVNMKYDAAGNSQLYAYRAETDGRWTERQITDWDYRFDFSGYGSIVFEIDLLGMRALPEEDQLAVGYTHVKYGEGEIVLDERTLEPLEVRPYTKPYPKELDTVTTTGDYAKPVVVNIDRLGNYVLRWETLAENNDRQPEGPVPGPYRMELIELE